MVHGLFGGPQGSARGWWLPGAEVAGVDGVGATGDLDPQAMTGREGVADGPQGYGRSEGPVGVPADGRRVEALQSVADVDGLAVG